VLAGEVVVGQIFEVLHVADSEVGEQVEATGEEEDLADFGDLIEAGDEGIDGIALMAGEF
jgi:hypothetical protein